MNIYTHLNVPVYDEFLRSVILGSEARWRSFHDAHILADKWFHEFNEKWAADSRVVATSKDEHVAALRLLNLYCFHWCKRVARIPAKLYREDYLPSGQREVTAVDAHRQVCVFLVDEEVPAQARDST